MSAAREAREKLRAEDRARNIANAKAAADRKAAADAAVKISAPAAAASTANAASDAAANAATNAAANAASNAAANVAANAAANAASNAAANAAAFTANAAASTANATASTAKAASGKNTKKDGVARPPETTPPFEPARKVPAPRATKPTVLAEQEAGEIQSEQGSFTSNSDAESETGVEPAETEKPAMEVDDSGWQTVGNSDGSRRKPGARHDEKAALVLVIDGVDSRRFSGRLAILKELQRVAHGVQTSAVLILQRGGVAVTCATMADKDMITSSPFWGDTIEPPFGIQAEFHEPRSVSGGSSARSQVFDEAKKVVFDSVPSDATKDDMLAELAQYGAVNATLFRRKFEKHGLASWMVETSTEGEAVSMIELGVGFFGLLLRARPCRSIKPPIRCSKCQQFGHAGIACSNQPICSECSGAHLYGDPDCPATAKKVSGVPGGKTCPNCKAAGRSELDHSAGWGGCPENKSQRQMLYAEIAAKHQADVALSEAKKAAADDKKIEQDLAANKIRAEIQGSCISSFCGMLTLFMEALLSGIAGDMAKSATVLDRQKWMLDQFETSLGHLPVPFADIRQKFKLKPVAPKK
jgi:hypothetical protein